MDTIILDNINGVNILKLVGRATMRSVGSSESILKKCDKTPILDFSELTYLDSTFLGLIAKYTMLFKRKNNEYLSIIKPNSDIQKLLDKTGILKFLIILDEKILINGKEIDTVMADQNQILDLHVTLMKLNEENKKEFAAVVSQMKKVMGSKDEV